MADDTQRPTDDDRRARRDETLADRVMHPADQSASADGRDRADDEPTRVVRDGRDEPTQVVHREGDGEPTRVLGGAGAADAAADERAREDERQAERRRAEEDEREAARRRRAEAAAARQRSLGTVTPSDNGETVAALPPRRITDRFAGAAGLFILRLVTAAIVGVRGFQAVTDNEGATAFLTRLGLPQPGLLAWVGGVAELLVAVALVFGFMVRIAGLVVAVIAIGTLVLVRWGAKNPFVAGQAGFVGEFDLLLAAVGITFLALGGGGWGIDAGIRRGRQRRRAGL